MYKTITLRFTEKVGVGVPKSTPTVTPTFTFPLFLYFTVHIPSYFI